jgi:hypothetical protein
VIASMAEESKSMALDIGWMMAGTELHGSCNYYLHTLGCQTADDDTAIFLSAVPIASINQLT